MNEFASGPVWTKTVFMEFLAFLGFIVTIQIGFGLKLVSSVSELAPNSIRAASEFGPLLAHLCLVIFR